MAIALPRYPLPPAESGGDPLSAIEQIDQIGRQTVPVGEERIGLQVLTGNVPDQAEHRRDMLARAQNIRDTLGSIVPGIPVDDRLIWEVVVTHDPIRLPRASNGSDAFRLATRLGEGAASHYALSSRPALPRDVLDVDAEYYGDKQTFRYGFGIELNEVEQVAHDIVVTADEMTLQERTGMSEPDAISQLSSRFSHPVYQGKGSDIVAALVGGDTAPDTTRPLDPPYWTLGVAAVTGGVRRELSLPPPGPHSVLFTVSPAEGMVDSRQIGRVATLISGQQTS